MAKLIEKKIEDLEGGACYFGYFDDTPTHDDLVTARNLPIKHECFSGVVDEMVTPLFECVEMPSPVSKRANLKRYLLGQAT